MLHIGPTVVQAELKRGYSNASVATDMASAVANAIKAVCKTVDDTVRPRIALLTPYITSIHNKNVEYLNANGMDVAVGYNLGFNKDTETTSMSPESIFEYGKCLVKLSDNVDALFIGCSGFRATGTRLMIHKVTVCNQVLFNADIGGYMLLKYTTSQLLVF